MVAVGKEVSKKKEKSKRRKNEERCGEKMKGLLGIVVAERKHSLSLF